MPRSSLTFRSWATPLAAPAWIITCWSPTVRSMAPCANISPFGRGGTDGISHSLVPRGRCARGAAAVPASPAAAYNHSAKVQLVDVFRAAHAELDPPSAFPLFAAALAPARFIAADCSGVCESLFQADGCCGGW